MRTALTALALGATLAMTGCIGGSSRVSESGTYVSDATLEHFEAGVTTESQVLDLLGAPDRAVDWKDGATLYVWRHQSKEKSSGHVFLLVAGNSESVRKRAVYVACRDGLVVEHWSETFRH